MRYACQVWGLNNNVACHRILTSQKCALRLVTFSHQDHLQIILSPIFESLNLFYLVEIMNILFEQLEQLFNIDLPEDLLNIQYKGVILEHS